MFCPLPILLAAREMMRMVPGDQLEIVGDDPAILEDMPVWCERTGHRLLELTAEGRRIVTVLEKGSRRPGGAHPPPAGAERKDRGRPSEG
jgi:tRNA 2-thiouridine synthesizing protein A